MGTTRIAINAGSVRLQYVAAIEGYGSLLTDAPSATLATTAWVASEWSTALTGLAVDIKVEQELNPDDPFASNGGTCTLWVLNETFGVDVAKRTGGYETYLTETLDRSDTTVSVKSTSLFASDGSFYIGTERIKYTSKNATTFNGCTRGYLSPFGTYDDADHFAHHHRVGNDANSVNLQPVVSSQPRHWIGRWVGVWAHRVVDGVLDVRSEAELVYAGRITEIRDDPNTGATVVSVRHVLDTLKDAPIGSSLWEGKADDGFYLVAGEVFTFSDFISGTANKNANALTVVANATGTNQIAPGWISAVDLVTKISSWLIAEKAATRINGSYSMAIASSSDGTRAKIYYTLGTSSQTVTWSIEMPRHAMQFLGFTQATAGSTTQGSQQTGLSGIFGSTSQRIHQADGPTMRLAVRTDGSDGARVKLTTSSGVVVDQWSLLPSTIKPLYLGYEWGLFLVNDQRLMIAAIDDTDPAAPELFRIQPAFNEPTTFWAGLAGVSSPIEYSSDEPNKMTVRQIYAFELELGAMLPALLLSTGTDDYNVSIFDALPYGSGCAIPYALFGAGIFSEIYTIPNATGSIAVIIDRPMKLGDLISSDLIFRWAFPLWKNGVLTFGAWKEPSDSLATVSLTETTKAEPSGSTANQRSATSLSDQWQRSIVKVRYNRDASDPKGDKYRSTVMFEDRVAADDAGDSPKIKTINLRNTYKEFGGTGQSVEGQLPHHMALMPLVSRPANIVRRSIDMRYFLSISVGDVVLFTDEFARDPATGLRGIDARAALVVRHTWSLGGSQPGGGTQPIVGEVDLFFVDRDVTRSAITYVPSADIDDTASVSGFSAGYDSSTSTIRCYAHRYSESTEAVDASHFAIGYKLLIIERDPLDGASPVSWSRTVSSVSGNDIVLTAALSAPAWDSTKTYRVVWQAYDAVVTAQQSKTYQADDADGLILDVAQPFIYSAGTGDSTYTANTSTEIELVPDATYGDGVGRDVGTDAALARMLDNGIDYKTAIQASMLFTGVQSNTTVTGTSYKLIAYWPIFLSLEIPSTSVIRYLSVAPMAASTDGTSTKIKVSIWRDKPASSTLTDIAPAGVYGVAEWSGITSTTFTTLAAQTITSNVKHPFTGIAWVVVECGYKCKTWGLAQFTEGARISL